MNCKNCGTYNEEDSLFCKQCGFKLEEDYVEENEHDNKRNKNKTKNKNKNKTKRKTKNKTKVKKQKDKNNNRNNNSDRSFGQSIMIFLLSVIILILVAGGIFGGYYYYTQNNVEVPSVVGLDYESAVVKLSESGLKVSKKEKETDIQSEVNKVLSQNKQVGKKVLKGSRVRLTVGVLKLYKVPNFKNKTVDEATNTLKHNNIKYSVTIKEVTSGDPDIVLSQTPSAGSKISSNDIVELVVSKLKEETEENKEEETTPTTTPETTPAPTDESSFIE